MNDNVFALIMAGGSGTRFWPLSTNKNPKQFLNLIDHQSMLQLTIERLTQSGLVPLKNIIIITGTNFVKTVLEQIPDIPNNNVIAEPLQRDTAPAITLGASLIQLKNPDAVMMVLPADHLISPMDQFKIIMEQAVQAAKDSDNLITLGIKPTYPAQGFGYLHKGSPIPNQGNIEYYRLNQFIEKPDKERAQTYYQSKDYFWNSGMFIWKIHTILPLIQTYLPDIYENIVPLAQQIGESRWLELSKTAFAQVQKISIDYGVMEQAAKAGKVAMIPANLQWNDIGNWNALADILPKDSNQNISNQTPFLIDSQNNIIISDTKEYPILCAGITDCIVVVTKNGTLICHKDYTERIKEVVKEIQS